MPHFFHNLILGRLPTIFSDIDIGKIVGFKNIPLTSRGEDLTRSYIIAGQIIYPAFLVIGIGTSNNPTFLAAQIHDKS